MNFTDIITSVATICPIIIIVIGIISSIYYYVRETRQENDEMKPYYQIQDDVCNILHNAFPTLKFIVDYDVDREILMVKPWDPCSQTIVEPKVFKFEVWKTDIDEILNTIIEWYDSCFNPKPEPIVEKVEVIVKPHHCECCGAPLKKDRHSCEYCGTEYF